MAIINPYDYSFSREEWCKLIDSYIFSERDRAILKRRLLDTVVFEKLAEEFGLSTVQVKRIVKYTSRQLFNHL